jgi:hypothetical protein
MTATRTSQSCSWVPDPAGGRKLIVLSYSKTAWSKSIESDGAGAKKKNSETLLHSIQFRLFWYVIGKAVVVMTWSWSCLSLIPFSKTKVVRIWLLNTQTQRERSLLSGDGIEMCYTECTQHSAYTSTNTDVIRTITPYKKPASPCHTKEFSECNCGVSVL